MEIFMHNLEHAVMITVFVFIMMMFVDYVEVLTKGQLSRIIKGGRLRQYVTASFLGVLPGCLGSFMNVSFYVRGLISFGAITAGMIATSGDEAFVMLALFPKQAIMLFAILFVVAVVSAYFVDKAALFLKIKPCESCRFDPVHLEEECRCLSFKEIVEHLRRISLPRFLLLLTLIGALYGFLAGKIGPDEWGWEKITFIGLLSLAVYIVITVPEHYLEEHIWRHIAKQHLGKIFLWTFGALLIVHTGLEFWDLEGILENQKFIVLILSGLIGLIPESGPHLIFVMLFAKGLVPFSVLLTSSIVQDGHGILPLLSYSVKDSVLIKMFNLCIGLGLGIILFSFGL